MNKADLIKKVAQDANISIKEATRAVQAFDNAINPKSEIEDIFSQKTIDNSHAWRGGSKKKGNKFKYIRK